MLIEEMNVERKGKFMQVFRCSVHLVDQSCDDTLMELCVKDISVNVKFTWPEIRLLCIAEACAILAHIDYYKMINQNSHHVREVNERQRFISCCFLNLRPNALVE